MLSADGRAQRELARNEYVAERFRLQGEQGSQCHLIDPSFIKKAGKHTPYVGTFWSGCAGAVKHGLEVLGIGVIDVDLHECMMLKAVQTTLEKGEEKKR